MATSQIRWLARCNSSTRRFASTKPSELTVKPITFYGKQRRLLNRVLGVTNESKVLKALSGTWKPLKQPLAPGHRSHTDRTLISAEAHGKANDLGVTAARHLSLKHDPVWKVEPLISSRVNKSRSRPPLPKLPPVIATPESATLAVENAMLDILAFQRTTFVPKQHVNVDPRAARALMVSEYFKAMAKHDSFSYNILASFYIKFMSTRTALFVAQEAIDNGHQLSLSVYNYLLKAQTGRKTLVVGEVLDVAKMMANKSQPVRPSAETFALMIDAFANCRREGMDYIRRVFPEMAACGVEPRPSVYSSFLRASNRYMNGQQAARQVINDLRARPSVLQYEADQDMYLFNTLARLLVDRKEQESRYAEHLYDLAEATGFKLVQDKKRFFENLLFVLSSRPSLPTAGVIRLGKIFNLCRKEEFLLPWPVVENVLRISSAVGDMIGCERAVEIFDALKKQLILHEWKFVMPFRVFRLSRGDQEKERAILRTHCGITRFLPGFLESFSVLEVYRVAVMHKQAVEVQFLDASTIRNQTDFDTFLTDVEKAVTLTMAMFTKSFTEATSKEDASILLDATLQLLTLAILANVPSSFLSTNGLFAAKVALVSQRYDVGLSLLSSLSPCNVICQVSLLNQWMEEIAKLGTEEEFLTMAAICTNFGYNEVIDSFKVGVARFPDYVGITALWLLGNKERNDFFRDERGNPPDYCAIWPMVRDVYRRKLEHWKPRQKQPKQPKLGDLSDPETDELLTLIQAELGLQ